MNENHYLRVDCNEKGHTVAINANKLGLEYLKECIEGLLKSTAEFPQDVSLMVPEWGGEGLTKDEPSTETTLVEHLRIFRWE
jgi:hypothetical protein